VIYDLEEQASLCLNGRATRIYSSKGPALWGPKTIRKKKYEIK
jgi:hypothetical protein